MTPACPAEAVLATAGGQRLALRDWPAGGPPRAVVQLVHGLGEHMGRYARLARSLHEAGFEVRMHDHAGHGRSTGARGAIAHPLQLVDDLAAVIDRTRAERPGMPLVLLGHSLGGLVAASVVARGLRLVEALVLSSPALDAGLSRAQRALLGLLGAVAPRMRAGNGLSTRHLSHDEAVVRAYRDDPLNHDRIGVPLARFLADEGARVIAAAPAWAVPTLLLYAGDDRLVRPAGSDAFAAAAPRERITARRFDGLYHEIFNEMPERAQPVYEALLDWLLRRFPASG